MCSLWIIHEIWCWMRKENGDIENCHGTEDDTVRIVDKKLK